jgi:uncharacterized protein YndB with AHSA1/START domain
MPLFCRDRKKEIKHNNFLVTIREFDAPRGPEFKAYTDPQLYIRWLGVRRLKIKLEKFEPTNGGSWKYVHRDEGGKEYAFHSVHHEVTHPERIISTFEFEGLPELGHVSLEMATFEELFGGKTKVAANAIFQSVADRDGMLQSGMEEGVKDSHVRLMSFWQKCIYNN